MATRLSALCVLLAATVPPAPAADPKKDLFDDPLPDGALARLGRAGRFTTIDFSLVPPDYTTYLVPTADGGVRRYEVATCRPVGPSPGRTRLGSAKLSADGKRALASRADGTLAVCDVETGKVVRVFAWGVNPDLVSVSADGSRVAVGKGGEKGGEVQVWDIPGNAVVATISVPYSPTFSPVLSPDGATVAVGGQVPNRSGGNPDTTAVRLYAVADGTERCRVPLGPDPAGRPPIPALAFSPDGKTLAVGQGTGPVELWEVPSGKPVRTLLGRTGQGYRVAFSPDGKQVAAVGTTGRVEWWSVADGQRVGSGGPPADVHRLDPAGVGFAPGGRVVAWARAGDIGVAWDAATGKALTPDGGHYEGVGDVAFAAGGREVLTAGHGQEGGAVRWDAATGRRLGRVPLRAPGAVSPGSLLTTAFYQHPILALAADGTRAVGRYRPQGVYDLATGEEVLAVPAGDGSWIGQYPSADLTRVAVCTVVRHTPTALSRVAVWDIPGERKVAEFDFPGHGEWRAAAFSPDNSRLVTVTAVADPAGGGTKQVVTGWDLATGKQVGRVDAPGEYVVPNGLAVGSNTAALVASGGRVWGVDYEAGKVGDQVDVGASKWSGPAAFSPDGSRFAVGMTVADVMAAGVPGPNSTVLVPNGYGVRVYDWPRGKVLRTFAGHSEGVMALRFSPDGKRLATAAADMTTVIWDVNDLGGKK